MREIIVSDSNYEQTVKALDAKADEIILNYSFLTGISGALPVPFVDVIVDFVGDSLLQYKMINDLGVIYNIKSEPGEVKRIIAVVFDNVIVAKVVSMLTGFLKVIPIIGQTIAPAAKYLVDFALTFIIGKVFKMIYRNAFINQCEPDYNDVSKYSKQASSEAIAYVKANWMYILKAKPALLRKYYVDLAALKEEMDTNIDRVKDMAIKQIEIMRDIYKNIGWRETERKELLNILDKVITDMGEVTLDTEITELELKKLAGEASPEEIARLEELKLLSKVTTIKS